MGGRRARPDDSLHASALVGASIGLASWESMTMHLRPARRALTSALIATLALAGVASADTVLGDGDAAAGRQTLVELGEVAPSALVTVSVSFDLICAGTSHPDQGQTVDLAYLAGSAPSGGAIVSVTGASIGPVGASWPADGATCASPAPTLTGTSATVVLRAPTVPNVGYMYTVGWRRTLSPAGANDGTAISGSATGVSFRLAVVANTAPVLSVPADMTVEADTTGGWQSTFAVSASDAEDDPDPTPLCSPAAGEVLPLGTTSVACSATDTGGLGDTASFDVTVVDTTAPALTGVPGDLDVTTPDPAGSTVDFADPTATDIADPAPAIACLPASGGPFPVGTTTVTCTAVDASGNEAAATFDVRVAYVPALTASAVWGEPVGVGTGTFVANRGRTIPVKVELRVDGVARQDGDAALAVTPCGGGRAVVLPLEYGGGRWNAGLDTSTLTGDCHTVAASIDGLEAGSFRLDLRGTEALKAKGQSRPR